ncbi:MULTISPECIES: RhuM family protein [Streptomyces]|uniref:RhuM family protein n=1 Tax=Streptomyces flavovirens TaxID=52258 RepID=A0ABV8NE91_9ACTN|nr:RhuM family protein [Streptomyces sp. MBT51]MBK3596284.1 virulence RhuM family protein [Streptomyces sp. MBT51]
MDAYGREYWDGRELMPLLGYSKWENFRQAIGEAQDVIAAEQGEQASDLSFSWRQEKGTGGKGRENCHLARGACYVTAMRGDTRKPQIRAALLYFAVRAREAELGALSALEVRDTALARAREMVDYKVFRDMMAENAPDYEPSTKATRIFFGVVQNMLYRQITGMTAEEIKNARPLATWPGREEGKPEPSPKSAVRKVAKNYLTARELSKLDRLVGRLCLTAEDIAEDGNQLSLNQWQGLVDAELAMSHRQLAA